MTRFSNTTVAELVDALNFHTHASIGDFRFRFDLQAAAAPGGMNPNCLALKQYLYAHQDALGPNGANIVIEVIEHLLEGRTGPDADWAHVPNAAELFPQLMRSLKRDGYVVANGALKALLPENVSLPDIDDELTTSLRELGLDTPLGHLTQARAAHTRGEWAAANAQLRTFIESLFDKVFERVVGKNQETSNTSHKRREALSKTDPPFLSSALNEWLPGGSGFVPGFWQRLHPEGSHPGLSDEEDSTFRLHMCLLVGAHYVRRLQGWYIQVGWA